MTSAVMAEESPSKELYDTVASFEGSDGLSGWRKTLKMLHKAARVGKIDLIVQFVRASSAHNSPIDFLDLFDADGVTPLHMAVMHGQVQCVEGLLELGSSPTIPCNGIPILHLAMTFAAVPHRTNTMTQIVRTLMKGGAPITAKDDEGQTVFHLMAKYGVMECLLDACLALEAILERIQRHDSATKSSMTLRDYLISQQDGVGDTAFHVAARFGNADVLRRLIETCTELQCGFIVRRVNHEGNTPLHVAAMNGHPEAAAVLLKVDPTCGSVLNEIGKTPSQLAHDNGHEAFLAMLLKLLKYGVGLWPNEGDVLAEMKPSCLPTWIVTSSEFRRHKTYPDHCRLNSLPPENNRRWSVLVSSDSGVLRTHPFTDLCWHPTPKKAEAHDILKVHDFSYYDSIRRQCAGLPPDNSDVGCLDGDTTISHDTFQCALLAAGCVCEAIDIVMRKQGRNAFCVVRPPGHHAGYRGKVGCPNVPVGSNGFCIFNNIAIGGAYALDVYRHAGIRKVAILDFDVHHGNGTEQCVMNTVTHKDTEHISVGEEGEIVRIKKAWCPWLGESDRQNILFASVQGYGRHGSEADNWFYPGSGRTRDNLAAAEIHSVMDPDNTIFTQQSEIDFDEGQACPRVINVGIGGPGDGTQFWKRCWRDHILPEVVEFDPDLILLSAGFDAHRRDDINGGFISLESHHYGWLTKKLTEVANKCCSGRIVSVLEGGYAVQGGAASAFASSVAAHVSALNAKNFKKWNLIDEEVECEAELENRTQSPPIRKRLREERTLETEPVFSREDSDPMDEGGREHETHLLEAANDADAALDEGCGRAKRRRQQVDYVAMDLEWRRQEEKNEL